MLWEALLRNGWVIITKAYKVDLIRKEMDRVHTFTIIFFMSGTDENPSRQGFSYP